ncbi:MAG: hypothetical protein ACU83O_12375 [Gammaproteobacteria bacterium]
MLSLKPRLLPIGKSRTEKDALTKIPDAALVPRVDSPETSHEMVKSGLILYSPFQR